MGFVIYGDTASPIVPLMLYNPAKIPYERARPALAAGTCGIGLRRLRAPESPAPAPAPAL